MKLKCFKLALPAAGALILFTGLLPACGSPQPATSSQIKVVTTSNILADWVRNTSGDRVNVFALVPIGADPHTFEPGAADVARVAEADVIFTVGLGLEQAWLNRLLENAAADQQRVTALGDYVDPLTGQENGQEGYDPHFWFDPLRVKKAVDEITTRLTAADPAGGWASASAPWSRRPQNRTSVLGHLRPAPCAGPGRP